MIWPIRYSQISLMFIFLVLIIHYTFFPQYIIPFEILFFGISVIIMFYVGLNYFSRRWSRINEKIFIKKLFVTSFFIKLFFFAATLLLIYLVNPNDFPFEIGGGADSTYYHHVASKIAGKIFSSNLSDVLSHWYKQTGDYGYPIYLGFFYHFIGNDSILVRIISLLISSLTVVLVYKLARKIYNEKIGRFAGILTMLMPPLLWFDTALLKESIMIFLIVLNLYGLSEIVLSRNFRVVNIVLTVIPLFLLFFFRSANAWLLIFVSMLYLLLNLSNRRISKPIILFSFLIIAIILSNWVVNTQALEELELMVEQSDTIMEDDLKLSALSRGVNLTNITVIPFIFAGAILTPFPSLLYIDQGHIVMVSHFFNELIRNSLYFFAFLGIWVSYKKRFKESSLIILYTLGYIFILAIANKSFQDRFVLPSLPGIIILISTGLAGGGIHLKKWKFYLIFVGLAIILWNLFKLNIRGLI